VLNIKKLKDYANEIIRRGRRRTFNLVWGRGISICVYTDDFEFTDYDLLHCDLTVTITDKDAVFYSDERGNRLNHSPETLGIKE
jgi:hypothetical protein